MIFHVYSATNTLHGLGPLKKRRKSMKRRHTPGKFVKIGRKRPNYNFWEEDFDGQSNVPTADSTNLIISAGKNASGDSFVI